MKTSNEGHTKNCEMNTDAGIEETTSPPSMLYEGISGYYGAPEGSVWRTEMKTSPKGHGQCIPFDLSEGLRKTNNSLWKEVRVHETCFSSFTA